MRAPVVTGANALVAGADPLKASLRLRAARLSRMDRLCALALMAADAALDHAGLSTEALAAIAPERIAIVVGTRFGCHATNEDYFRGLLAEGPRGASPRLFAYTLPSSPLGELAIHFGARGAAQTVATGRHAGLEAVARAATLCASGRADLAIAVAVEVGGGALVGSACQDGAAALIIEAAGHAEQSGRVARGEIAGAGFAFDSAQPAQAQSRARVGAFAEAQLRDHAALPALPVAEGQGAVEPVTALVNWLSSDQHGESGGSGALALASDPAGGAAALIVTRRG